MLVAKQTFVDLLSVTQYHTLHSFSFMIFAMSFFSS